MGLLFTSQQNVIGIDMLFIRNESMKHWKSLIIVLTLFVGNNSFFAAESDQIRVAPRVHAPLWRSFSLSDVELTDSYFKRAMDLNKEYLLSLEVDRLIPHVRRGVGLQGKGKNYGGWEQGGGCSYGHYMSACAMMYASTGEKAFLDRLNYLLDELKECQEHTPDGWFITGKAGRDGYQKLLQGEVILNKPDETKQPWNYNSNGNSWYCVHKVMAGLRDAYTYAGLQQAKEILLPIADFIVNIVLNSNKDLFQSTLSVEQGGMSEVFADLYGMTGNRKYLQTSERFNHINVIYPTANGEDVLFGRHANDQIPKFVGAAKEYEYSSNEIYHKAARNFWDIVIGGHTVAIGGNSCYERFGLPGEESKRLDFSSAETCNTYNMLKLSRQLFMMDGDYKYMNYYEHALYNHILASQDPDMPGCVTYYTSLMPGSFKQYSTPYDSFWCCVGTGMENHSKYAESVYFEDGQDLLVNLYIPSRLNWEEKGLRLTMDTCFPESDTVTVKVDEKGNYDGALLFRYPDWVDGDAVLRVNGKKAEVEARKGGCIRLLSRIQTGDVITLVLKRGLHVDYAEDEPHFGSLMYGPILLAGELGKENMPADRVSDNRTCRDVVPVKDIPALVGSLSDLDSWVIPSDGGGMRFAVKNGGGQRDVSLIPYFRMHHQRHTVYWKIYSPDEYEYRSRSLTDCVEAGNEKDEERHKVCGLNDTVCWHDYFWAKNTQYRVADNGWFAYTLRINPDETKPYNLICRFWGDESDAHLFDILVDDRYLCTVNLNRKLYLTYVDDIYPIPAEWTKGKDKVKITFRAKEGKKAGGLYELKITSDTDYR